MVGSTSVRHIDRLVEFYRDRLGFEMVAKWERRESSGGEGYSVKDRR